MDNILKQYHPISLGYNCFIKRYLDDTVGKGETNMFDWIGTSMWAIHMMLRDNFLDLFDMKQFTQMQVLINDKPMNTHQKYYVRVPHDDLNTFAEKYQRRLVRLKEVMSSGNKILFIRLEEYLENKVIQDRHKGHYRNSELHHIKKFIGVVSGLYPTLEFSFLLISRSLRTKKTQHLGHDIIIIRAYTEINDWKLCITQLNEVFKYHEAFLKESLLPQTE